MGRPHTGKTVEIDKPIISTRATRTQLEYTVPFKTITHLLSSTTLTHFTVSCGSGEEGDVTLLQKYDL